MYYNEAKCKLSCNYSIISEFLLFFFPDLDADFIFHGALQTTTTFDIRLNAVTSRVFTRRNIFSELYVVIFVLLPQNRNYGDGEREKREGGKRGEERCNGINV